MINIENMLKVYFIAGTQNCLHFGKETPEENLLFILEEALKGGITCFQFREKGTNSLSDRKRIVNLAKECQKLCKKYNVPFVINNDVDLACELQADGVHIGQEDRPLSQTIKQVQDKLFIGLSVSEVQDATKIKEIDQVAYFGVGPIYTTTSKEDARQKVGLEIIKNLRNANISKPLVAIGGIDEKRAKEVLKCDVNGIATISAITKSKNLKETIEKLKGK